MILQCPNCESVCISTLNRGRNISGIVGAVGGVLYSWRTGALLGLIASPLITGPVTALPLLVRCTAVGYGIGAAVGAVIDTEILDNHQCRSCGCSFSSPPINYI